eukprot:7157707-Prymnesium_polylepis.1
MQHSSRAAEDIQLVSPPEARCPSDAPADDRTRTSSLVATAREVLGCLLLGALTSAAIMSTVAVHESLPSVAAEPPPEPTRPPQAPPQPPPHPADSILAQRVRLWNIDAASGVDVVASSPGEWVPTSVCPAPLLWLFVYGHHRTFHWTKYGLHALAEHSAPLERCYMAAAVMPEEIC